MENNCVYNFSEVMLFILDEIYKNSMGAFTIQENEEHKKVITDIAIFFAKNIFSVENIFLKKCAETLKINQENLFYDEFDNFNDLLLTFSGVIHTNGINGISHILKNLIRAQSHKGVRIDWNKILNEIVFRYGEEKIMCELLLIKKSLNSNTFKSNNVENFIAFFNKFLENAIRCGGVRRLSLNISKQIKKCNLNEQTVIETINYCANSGFQFSKKVIENIFLLLVRVENAKIPSKKTLTYGGGLESFQESHSAYCNFKPEELFVLKRAAELLTKDEAKYHFMIDQNNIEKGCFITYYPKQKQEILDLIVQLNFEKNISLAKKLTVKRIKNHLVKINNILQRNESQNFLKNALKTGNSDMIPEDYEVLHERESKIPKASDFYQELDQNNNLDYHEGTGMINTGNLCFAISSFQLLFHLNSYVTALCQRDDQHMNKFEISMRKIFSLTQKNQPVSIEELKTIMLTESELNQFCEIDTYGIKNIRQSDASEFIINIHELFMGNSYKSLFFGYDETKGKNNIFLEINSNKLSNNEEFENELTSLISEIESNQINNNAPVILIHINRLDYKTVEKIDMTGKKKNVAIISINNSEIDIPESLEFGTNKYKLKSVISHMGQFDQGHYTAICKHLLQDNFYLFNDCKTEERENFYEVQQEVRKNCSVIAYEIVAEIENINDTSNLSPRKSKLNNSPKKLNPVSHKSKYEINKKTHKKLVANYRNIDNKQTEKKAAKMKRNNLLLEHNKNLLTKFENTKNKCDNNYAKVFKDSNLVPEVICDSCDRICFRPETVNIDIVKLHDNYNKKCKTGQKIENICEFSNLVNRPFKTNERRMCKSCYETINSGKLSIYGPKDGIKFREISENLRNLTNVAERLISPVIPFIQVKELKPYSINTHLGTFGSIVNIEIDVSSTVTTSLPRKFDELSVQQIMLKRDMKHKTHFMYETVNVKQVLDALVELKNTPLYKDLKMNIDEKVFSIYDQYKINDNNINFIANSKLIDKEEKIFLKSLQDKAKELEQNNDTKEIDLKHIYLSLSEKNNNKQEEENKNKNSQNEEKEIESLLEGIDFDEELGNEGLANDVLVVNLPINADIVDPESEVNQKINDENEEEVENKKKDKTIIIAPGQGKEPIQSRSIEFIEEKCFPSLYGGFPLEYNREKISKVKRYKHQIQNHDRRFCVTKSLFHMGKLKLEMQLQSAVSIAMRIGLADKNITVKQILNNENLNNFVRNDEAFRFLRRIIISPAYLEEKRKVIFGYFRQLGSPSLFLTLSPCESMWAPLLRQLYKNANKSEISDIEALNLPEETKFKLIRDDPVLCSQYFQRKCNKVIDYLKIINNKILGLNYVVDDLGRQEFQMRGSAHRHTILYCNNFPIYRKNMPKKDWINFQKIVDSIISTEFDVNNPNIFNQIHMCTFTCFKYRAKTCRFKFPKYPMSETTVLEPFPNKDSDQFKKAAKNLIAIKKQLEEYRKLLKDDYNKMRKNANWTGDLIKNFDTLDIMLEKLNLTYKQYLEAIRTDITKPTLFHKRSPNAIEINNYNKHLLDLWGANLDIQVILDKYACANYLFSYLLKADIGIIRLLKQALREYKLSGLEQKKILRNLASKFNHSVTLGAAQISEFLLSYPMTRFSRSSIFINTGEKEKRLKSLKKKTELSEMEEDDTDLFERGLLDYYVLRSPKYENICLADFAALYSIVNTKSTVIELKPRKAKPRIIRFVRYNEKKDPKLFYREQLMLYKPYRNEDIELNNKTKEELKKDYDALKKTKKYKETYEKYNKKDFCDQVEECLNDLRLEREKEFDETYFKRQFHPEVEEVNIFDENGSKKKVNYSVSLPLRIPVDEYRENMRLLNEEQRAIVNEILMSCIKNKMNRLLFLSGCAGVGKSFVIKTIYQAVTRFFDLRANNDEDKDKCKVLLTASTGAAAHLLDGTTFHSAFKFSKYTSELSENVATSIRSVLRHLELVVIDEVSMMSSYHLHLINERMQMIFGNDSYFGGKMVLLVGDFLQLPPVSGRPIYVPFMEQYNKDDMQHFAKDLLWENCEYHELTQVVRQKDKFYAAALLNLARGCMTDEQVAYIKKREVKSDDEVPKNVVRLFYLNSEVDAYNLKKLNAMGGNQIIAESEDSVFERNLPPDDQKLILLEFENDLNIDVKIHKKLPLMIGIRYMITINLDVIDGLVNGMVGILKFISFNAKNEPDVLWFDFKSNKVGRMKRSSLKTNIDPNIAENWIPISRERIEVQKKPDKKNKQLVFLKEKIVRNQFPLTVAEAITVHKSQGQTYKEGVCIDLTKSTLRADLMFVALSRTDYDSVYIIGSFEKPTGKSNEDGIKEIDRLRKESRMKLTFDTLKDVNRDDFFTVMYQNINSFSTKSKFLFADSWFSRHDVLVFSEANVNDVNESQILQGFKVIFPLKEHNYISEPNRGLVIMSKISRNIVLHRSEIYEDTQLNIHLDLKSFVIDDHYIICGYKTKETPSNLFRDKIQLFLTDLPPIQYVTIIGDFNIDSGKSNKFQSQILSHIKVMSFLNKSEKKEIKFFNQLSKTDETSDRRTQIDVVFSTSLSGTGGIYPTYFSDHNAVFYRSKKRYDIEEESTNFDDSISSIHRASEKRENVKKNIKINRLDKNNSSLLKQDFVKIFTEDNIQEKIDTKLSVVNDVLSQNSSLTQLSQNAKINLLSQLDNNNLYLNTVNLFDGIILKNAVFKNTIKNVVMKYDNGMGNYKIKNLSAFNSCFHGFLKLYHKENLFRQFCKEDKDFSIFRFLFEMPNMRSKKSFYWAKFILTQFERKSKQKQPTKFDSQGRKKFFIDMQNDSNIMTNVFESANGETLLGESFSIVKETVCSKCKLTIHNEYFRQQFLKSVQKSDFKNIIPKIFNKQNLEEMKSEVKEILCEHTSCDGKLISNLKFGLFGIFTIQKNITDGKLYFDDLFYHDFMEEIVLKNVFNEYRIYQLEFIQHFETIRNDVGHYTAILNYYSKYIEIDDLSPEHTVSLSRKSFINPSTIVYFDQTDPELIKSKVFDNHIKITLKLTSTKVISKNLYNMCCYNAFIHGILRFYRFNKVFQDFVDQNKIEVPLFKIIPKILQSTDQTERNHIWCEFLYSLDEKKFNSEDMSQGDGTMLYFFFNDFFGYYMKCLNCGYIPLKSSGEKYGNSHLYISIPSSRKLEKDIISTFIYNFFKSYGRNRKCVNCNESLSYASNDLLMIHIFSQQYMIDGKTNRPELTFNQLPHTLLLNGKSYKLIFVEDNKMPYLWHFVTKFNLSNDTHLEIDDMKSRAELLTNDKLTNPKILVYFCIE